MAVVLGLSVGFMGTTFADGINISQTNSDGTVQQGNTVSGTNKILIGTEIEPHSTSANSETGSIAIGDKIKYGGERSIAIGTDLKTSNDNSILIGSNMVGDAYSTKVIAIGNNIGTKNENDGTYNLGDTQRLIAIGNDVITAPLTSMENFNSVIIGNNSKVTGNNNIVLGNKSSDEKLMEQTTEHANEDENADPEDATIFILPNGSGFGGAALKKKTGDGYLVIGNEGSSRRIAYVAAGVDDSDAANMEQLRSLAKNKISLGGDTGQTKKLELGVENLTAPNENRLKFNITGDGNYISTAASGTSVSTSFKTDQFVADQLPVTFVNADGKKLVKMKVTNGGATTEGFYVIDDLVDGKVSAGTDPVAPSDVFLSLANPTSTNPNKAGEPIKLLNIKNVLALSNMPTTMSNAAAFSSDNVRVVRNMLTGAQEQGITPNPNQTPFYSISGSDLYRPVTVGDLQAIASAGITFKATSGDEVVRRLGETLTIKGGGKVFNTDFSAKNITTKTDNNELIIGLKTAPDFKKITFHEGKASISNDSESNPTQFIFQGAQQADGTYSKMKLTNLADANIVANNSDAVTGGQIFSSLKTVSSDVIAIKANNANGQAVTPKMWLDGNTATNVFLTLNDRSITETKLADAAVTKDKIANNAVTTNKIADNSIPIGKLNTTLQTTINSIGDKLDASRAQFTISDSKTNSTINLNTETAPTIVVKSGNTSALQVALNSTDNTFTITPQTYTGDLTGTLNTANGKKLVTATTVKTALDTKLDTSKALFKIQDDTTTTKDVNLNTTTPPTVRVKGDSSVIEVKFDNNDLKVSAKVADNTAANFVNNTNQNLLATPLGVKNYINSLLAPTSANDFGNTTANGGKLATAQGVVNYVNANKVKYFSVNTTQDWMGNPHNDGNANNDGARGENSLVIGRASSTQRQGSLFVGNGITDSGLGNGGSWTGFNGGFVTVVGNNNTIQRPQSMFPQVEEMGITVLGSMNNIIGRTTKVFGFNNNILGPANLGIGDNLTVNGTKGENVAIIMTSMNLNNGPSADREQGISGDGNVGIGSGVLITSKTQQAGTFPVKAVAIGYDTKVYAVDSIAIGRQALGEAQGGIALGSDARTTKQGATYNSEMIKTGYNPGNTPVPSNNNTWQANRSELSLGQYDGSTGQSSVTRRIANVAAGVLDADAVNVAQLKQITLGVQDDTANTPNKLYMKLYDDTNKKVNLLNMVSDTDKNIKVTVVPDENKVKFGLKPELKGITSITNTADGSTTTGGATLTISNDGLKVTTGTNPNENNILIGKDGKISGLADADISATSTEAVTGKQLKALADNVNTTINNLTGTMVYTDDAGNKLTKVGDKFYKTSALSNYALANDGKYYDKTKVNPLTGEVTDKKATAVDLANTVPQTDQVTADKVITSAVNSDGSTTSAQIISNVASGLGLDNMNKTATGGTVSNTDKQSNAGSTTITSDNARTAIAGTNKDGKGGLLTKSGAELHKVATVGDLQAVSMAGLTFTADETGKEIHRPLGTALKISATNSITATNTADFTTTNLGTKIDTTNNVISIEMKKALTDINSITSTADTDLVIKKGGTDKPSVKISDDGLTVTMPNPAGATTTINPIIIGKDGKITGLANGTADTDAVNVSQLNTKADKDGSNLITTTGTTKTTALDSTAQGNWATALGTGTIGSGDTTNGGKATDNNLVTGKTVYDSIKDMVKYDSDKHNTITLGIPAGQTGATTTKITNLTDGDITSTSTDAVTGKQIKSIVDNVNTTINNLTSTMVYTDDAGNRLTKVGDKFYKTSALSNYALANDGKYYEKSKVDPVTGAVENGANEVDLSTTVTGDDQVAADKVITSAVNGSGSTISAQTIGNIASGLGLDNMKILDNGTQANTSSTAITQDKAAKVIAGDNKDGKGGLLTKAGAELHKVATVGDLQALAMAGLTFTADEENKEIHRPLGTALKIVTGTAIISSPKAGANPDPNAKTPNDDKFTNANLGTRIDDADNVIGIQMKKDLTDINSITSTANTDLVIKKGGTDKPSITINDDGLKVTTGAAGTTQSNILIGKDGKISGLKDGTIATGSTDAVTGNQIAGLTVAYKSSTGGDTTAKTVTLTNGFDFKAGSGTTGTATTGTDVEKAKKGIVIETKANGEIVIGLDEATRKKIDETSDEVVVVDGDNTTAEVDTTNQEAGKKKYKVNINKDLNNINSITSEKGNDLSLTKQDGSKVVLGENGINLTAGSGTDAKTITINKDGTISGVTSGLKLDNTTPIDKDAAISVLNGTEDKTNPANSKPGLLGATGDALNNITTVKDLQAVAQAGLTFKTDGGEEIHRPLGSALSLTTGIKVNDSNKTAYEFASPNLGTVVNPATGTINFVFKSQPTFNGISFSGGPAGNVLNMNKAGQLFITKDGKDELLGINVKKFDGKSYFVPLNGTIEFKDTANVVADVTGKTESTLAPAGLAGGTGGTPSVASPTSGPAPLSTGSAFFDGVDTTTDAKPPASTTVDATVEWKIPDNAPIKITIDESKMTDDQIVNKKYVDSKLGPVVNNMTQITNHINVIRQESNAGIASAFAASHVPQVINTSDRNLVGVGFGSYHGANAVAIGLSGTNRSRTVVWKLTGTYDSSNSFGIGAGLGFSYGPKNRYKDEENNVLKPAKLNDFNERITRQQIEIDTLKDFIKDMQEQHKAEIEELKNQIKTMQTH